MTNPLRRLLHHLRCHVEKHGLTILRLSLATVFFWFGFLKFFEGNAAEALASDTIAWLTFGAVGKEASLILLGTIECGIGLALFTKKLLHIAIPILYVQMLGTLLPLFILPEKTWVSFGMPTLEGQYIVKNAVLIAAGIILGASARGAKLITHARVAREAREKEERIAGRAD